MNTNRTFRSATAFQSAMTAISASVLSVVTVGAVLALFATATPDAAPATHVVLEKITLVASKKSA